MEHPKVARNVRATIVMPKRWLGASETVEHGSGRMSTGGMSDRLAGQLNAMRAAPVRSGRSVRSPREIVEHADQTAQAINRLLRDCALHESKYDMSPSLGFEDVITSPRSSQRPLIGSCASLQLSPHANPLHFCWDCHSVQCKNPLPTAKLDNTQELSNAAFTEFCDDVWLVVLKQLGPVQQHLLASQPFSQQLSMLMTKPVRYRLTDHLKLALVACSGEKEFRQFVALFTKDRVNSHPAVPVPPCVVFYGELCVPSKYRVEVLDVLLSGMATIRSVDFDLTLDADCRYLSSVIGRLVGRRGTQETEEDCRRRGNNQDGNINLSDVAYTGPPKGLVTMAPLLKKCNRDVHHLDLKLNNWSETNAVKAGIDALFEVLTSLTNLRRLTVRGSQLCPVDWENRFATFLHAMHKLESLVLDIFSFGGFNGAAVVSSNRKLDTLQLMIGCTHDAGGDGDVIRHQKDFSMAFVTEQMGQDLRILDLNFTLEDTLPMLERLPRLQLCSMVCYTANTVQDLVTRCPAIMENNESGDLRFEVKLDAPHVDLNQVAQLIRASTPNASVAGQTTTVAGETHQMLIVKLNTTNGKVQVAVRSPYKREAAAMFVTNLEAKPSAFQDDANVSLSIDNTWSRGKSAARKRKLQQ